jgi:hypothetical protein
VLAALAAQQEAGPLGISPLVITSSGGLLTMAVQPRAEEAFGASGESVLRRLGGYASRAALQIRPATPQQRLAATPRRLCSRPRESLPPGPSVLG